MGGAVTGARNKIGQAARAFGCKAVEGSPAAGAAGTIPAFGAVVFWTAASRSSNGVSSPRTDGNPARKPFSWHGIGAKPVEGDALGTKRDLSRSDLRFFASATPKG